MGSKGAAAVAVASCGGIASGGTEDWVSTALIIIIANSFALYLVHADATLAALAREGE